MRRLQRRKLPLSGMVLSFVLSSDAWTTSRHGEDRHSHLRDPFGRLLPPICGSVVSSVVCLPPSAVLIGVVPNDLQSTCDSGHGTAMECMPGHKRQFAVVRQRNTLAAADAL